MYKIMMLLLLCLFVWNGHAQAACVASVTATTPTADFVDNGDGTVLHKKTALTWKHCPEGKTWNAGVCSGAAIIYNWQGALQRAETLNNTTGFATYTDWRVPNQKELASIIEAQCNGPAINSAIFPLAQVGFLLYGTFWASTPAVNRPFSATSISFTDGVDLPSQKTLLRHVRLVRGGP